MSSPTNQKGDVAAAAVLAVLVQAGLRVLVPWGTERYDLAVDNEGQLVRLQVKLGRLYDGGVVCSPCSVLPDRKRRRSYEKDEIDFFAIYCPELPGQVFLIHVIECPKTELRLRLSPSRNGQKMGLRWAKDYLFTGSIPQVGASVSAISTPS